MRIKNNPQTGVYGNVIIDVPKVNGQLNLIAYKHGKKVYDKQVDFDTIDLLILTRRFNSEKNNIRNYQKWFLMDLTN